jgi:hypothetical protein
MDKNRDKLDVVYDSALAEKLALEKKINSITDEVRR